MAAGFLPPSHWPAKLTTRLAALYGQSHRHYHGQAHVDALLAWLAHCQPLAISPVRIEAAIWFHDAVYEPERTDNEQRSAELAEFELHALGWPDADVRSVAAMVRATRLHEAPAGDADTRLFLDLDLSVLAQSPAQYAAYRDAIRAEYAWVDADRYREGRQRVLRAFTAREHIYFTPELREAWEPSARRNLANELAELAAPQAPDAPVTPLAPAAPDARKAS